MIGFAVIHELIFVCFRYFKDYILYILLHVVLLEIHYD